MADGKKIAAKLKLTHGNDFYIKIGRKGGAASNTGGFFNDPERARRVGSTGGKATVAKYGDLMKEWRSKGGKAKRQDPNTV